MRPVGEHQPATAADCVSQAWFAALPGRMLGAVHLWLLADREFGTGPLVKYVLNEDTLVGSSVADGHGDVDTDFALHADGFVRMVLPRRWAHAEAVGPAGAAVAGDRGLPHGRVAGPDAAREAAAVLADPERELAALADAIRAAARDEEPQLLDRLTRLAAQVESQYAATHSPFSASAAYFELVDRRVAGISESRLPGLQTLGEFINRRLSPSRATCEWSGRRQDALSQRVSRISNLLRTRVEIEQQQSSQALLGRDEPTAGPPAEAAGSGGRPFRRRHHLHYIVGLVSYLAKGAQALC